MDVAYYYPEPIFAQDEGKQLQPLVLLFDAIGLLVPTFSQPSIYSHPYVSALHDNGILKVISPETAVTSQVAESVAEVILELLTAGAFERAHEEPESHWEPLSGSRIGLDAGSVGAEYMCSELVERGLAHEYPGGEAYYLPRQIRIAYLLILAQQRDNFAGVDGMTLHPTMSTHSYRGLEAAQSFIQLLDAPGMPTQSRATILGHDLTILDCDLSEIPLYELLAYKAENQDELTRYRANLREWALLLSLIDDEGERQAAQLDREREILEAAHDLRRSFRRAWATPNTAARFGVGVVGAGWSIATSNPVGAAIAGMGALASLVPGQQHRSAYSYLIRAGNI